MLLDAFWLGLLIKMAATVSVVLAASFAAERAGPFWGGLLCALPLSAGPAYILLAMQADAGFIADSALASVAGSAAANLYLLAVIRLASRWPATVTVAIGLVVWLGAILAIRAIAWTPVTALLADLVTFAVGCVLTRDALAVTVSTVAKRGRFDLPLRGLAIAVLVAVIVTASHILGPRLTGIVIVFPISLVSFTAVAHTRLGGRAAAATMANGLRAMPGFFLALWVLHLLVPSGIVRALFAGLATSVGYALAMMAWRAYAGGAPASASSQRRNSATLPPSSSPSGLTHQ
jgi:hypothetical protein